VKIEKIGEFGLIKLLRKKIFSKDRRIIVNIGDDAAVIKSSKDKLLILTTDALIEKVHFDLKYCTLLEVGWKSLVANLSDIAAMGGTPLAGVVSLGIPKKSEVGKVLTLYQGMQKAGKKYNCPLVGGDTVFSPKGLVISIAVLGEVKKESITTRSGAKQRDLVCVTGDLGLSQFGLELLKKIPRKTLKSTWIKKHLLPEPRIEESQFLVKNFRINSMIDISDGLSSEINHIANESKVGAIIYEEKIPINPLIQKNAKLINKSPLDLALNSGEEYELLFTLPEKYQKKLDSIKDFKISVIGKIVSAREGLKIVGKDGKKRNLEFKGYTHF
jgi:thiamine-monophosphate kinase